MVRWKQETPHDYRDFIVHILTLSRILTEPVGCGSTDSPQHESICCLF